VTALEGELSDFIAAIVLPDRCPDVLSPDVPLLGGSILDSLALLQLIEHLEERYGLVLENDQLDELHLGSVRAIADCVRAASA